jgi:hypothetical protein
MRARRAEVKDQDSIAAVYAIRMPFCTAAICLDCIRAQEMVAKVANQNRK